MRHLHRLGAGALLVLGFALAPVHAQSPPPWRTPEWRGEAPRGGGSPGADAPPGAGAAAARPAPGEDVASSPQLFGRAATFLAEHALLEPGPARERLVAGGLVLRADGARFVVADNAAENPTVRVFAPYPGGRVKERGYLLGHLSPVRALLVTDDFRILATAGGGEGADAEDSLRLWNAEALNRRTPALKLRHGAPIALAAAPDGSLFAIGDASGHVTVFRDRHGRQRGESVAAHTGPVRALAFSTDGRWLFSAAGPDDPAPLRASRPRPLELRTAAIPFAPESAVTALAVGNAGGVAEALFVGEEGGRVAAIDPADGRTIWEARVDGAVRRIRPLDEPAAVLVAAEGSPHPLTFDPGTGAVRPTLRSRHATGLLDVAVDLGTGLVALAHRDGVVELWRIAGAPHPDAWR